MIVVYVGIRVRTRTILLSPLFIIFEILVIKYLKHSPHELLVMNTFEGLPAELYLPRLELCLPRSTDVVKLYQSYCYSNRQYSQLGIVH